MLLQPYARPSLKQAISRIVADGSVIRPVALDINSYFVDGKKVSTDELISRAAEMAVEPIPQRIGEA